MKLGVLMDPLDHIKPYKDSTVAMLESAQAFGWSCAYFTSANLYCEKGQAFARVTPLTINRKDESWVQVKESKDVPLHYFDIILMRKDPPFDLQYIYATYVLDLAQKEGVLVANNPQSLRDANEKFFTLHFPQCCPATLVSSDVNRLRAFWQKHQQVIYKPLDGMGGRSVFYVGNNGENLGVILETLTQGQNITIMAQQFIPEIKNKGDKRILLINGVPIPYGLARIPAEGELRGNLAAGGWGKVEPLTARDYWICKEIAPTLQEKGLYFAGIDVIGDYLTEINVTSPTCIQEIARETGVDIAGKYLEFLQGLVNK